MRALGKKFIIMLMFLLTTLPAMAEAPFLTPIDKDNVGSDTKRILPGAFVCFTQTQTYRMLPYEMEHLNQQFAQIYDFYRLYAGEHMRLNLTYIQVNRPISVIELEEADPLEYRMNGTNAEADLWRKGIKHNSFEFYQTWWAWSNSNTWGYRPSAGGTAWPLNNSYMGNAVYSSLQYITGQQRADAAIHELMHQIEYMLKYSNLGTIWGIDHQNSYVLDVIATFPGAYEEVGFTDDEVRAIIASGNAGNYSQNWGGSSWGPHYVYLKSNMLNLSRDRWLAINDGYLANIPTSDTEITPLFHTYILEEGDDFYLPILLRDSNYQPIPDAKVTALVNGIEVPLDYISYANKSGQRVLFANAFYGGWIRWHTAQNVTEIKVHAYKPGVIDEWNTVIIKRIKTAAVIGDFETSVRLEHGSVNKLQVNVVQDNYNRNAISGAQVQALIGDKELTLLETEEGFFEVELPLSIPRGTYPLVVQANHPDYSSIASLLTKLTVDIPWHINAPILLEVAYGSPWHLAIRAINGDIDEPEVTMTAHIAGIDYPIERQADGYFTLNMPPLTTASESVLITAQKAETDQIQQLRVFALQSGSFLIKPLSNEITAIEGTDIQIDFRCYAPNGQLITGNALPIIFARIGMALVIAQDEDGDGISSVVFKNLAPGTYTVDISASTQDAMDVSVVLHVLDKKEDLY